MSASYVELASASGGALIATDLIATKEYQIFKPSFGALGTATLVSTTDGLPVQQDDAAWNIDDIIPGVGATNLGKAEDAVHGTGDTGVMALVVRNDTLAALAGTDGDYAPLQVNASGALFIQEGAAMDVSAATVTTTPAITGGGTEATAQRVTIANDSTGVLSVDDNGGTLTVDVGTALPAGTNAIGKLAANTGVDIGDVDILSIAAGSNLIGDVSIAPRTTGGLSGFTSVDLDESEEEIKGTAGQIYGIYAWNATAAPLWLQIFDNTAAAVTVGTTAPTWNYLIPANADSDGAGVQINIPQGLACSTGITMAVTTGSGTTAGAPAANAAGVFVTYK